MAKSVVIGHARSGTTMLVFSLRRHTGLMSLGEVFNSNCDADIAKYVRTAWDTGFPPWSKGQNQTEYLAQHIWPMHRDVSIKVLYHQLEDEMWDEIGKKDIRTILMTRDPLSMFVSLEEAHATNIWNWWPAGRDKPEGPDPITFRMDKFISHTNKLVRLDRRVRSRASQLLEVSYQRLCEHYDDTMRVVFDYLKVRKKVVKPMTGKLATKTYAERVANWDEVRPTLRSMGVIFGDIAKK